MARHISAATIAVTGLLIAGCGGGATSTATSSPRPRPRPAAPAPAPRSAAARFVADGCGACHALRAAGARGRTGPDFDTSEVLTRAQIRTGILEGANGMPSYRGRISDRELRRLTALIAGAMRGRR